MKRLTVSTAADIRRWDTYIVAVPDNFDPDAEASEREIIELLSRGKGEHQGTDYEFEYDNVPDDIEITEITAAED
ncbi:hypothetical protein ACFWPH_33290 [Nocardia sp. NPDC058499]|uniref:hypothetical protein n=1 Tax=Nocardia sp. NPDC058499 TaxID=3346530 RepID=UPI0036473ECC